ncbi:serpentine receptor, putative [Plasmodium gallinaceum]|uniref:Serpentine receptor, putative n=1 Tax=Plasmodium gallinaceum TaxID=5849 RepID=A0A1J1GZ72_PLAGA|nr:serpentine receptor, putative [Plasmodium gallinaceum]CRG97607.1 serpentine receptor, putative [Plasmodium gallinaceum]
MAKRLKVTVTILSILFFIIFTGIHTIFTAFNKRDWLELYTSCYGTDKVKWELLIILTIFNFLFLLVNVNYKENISNLNNKKSQTSDINDDLINLDMNDFSNEKDESSEENEKEKIYNKLKIRYLYNISNSFICYYSMWILCYYLIYFLCFLSFLYGIRIFSNNLINIYTVKTCKIDKMANYMLSESTFISFYWSIINFNVFLSKYTDSFYISNYLKINMKFSNKKKKIIFLLNYAYQVVLLLYSVYKNILLFTRGEYNLSQVICSLIFLCLILYTILEITHVLEINKPCYISEPKLPFHYIWAIICLFTIFISSIMFYFSVFSYYIKDQFVNFQIVLWFFFITLTYIKKHQLFIKV